MNDKTLIEISDGVWRCFATRDMLNASLAEHGLHIAPLPAPAPPQQTEAERLAELANLLPLETWHGSGWKDPYLDPDGDIRLYGHGGGWFCFSDAQFRTILLGVMAAYVGTDIRAGVQRVGEHDCAWWNGRHSGIEDDLLSAYAACCKAIAERRKGGA